MMSPSPKRGGRASEQINSVLGKYLNSRRRLGDTKRPRSVTVSEMAAIQVLTSAASTPNLVTFSTTAIDHSAAESQYTAFKFWISESEDHYKPELAQLLYPLFTHLYIRLLVHCAGPLAVRFHKRHLATFLGNPEFKLFIQQLAEVGSAEELEQSQAVASYRAAKYTITLTEGTYQYLLKYLENSDSGLLLQILNQEVELSIGDPLGAGSRQEARAGLAPHDPEGGGGEEAKSRLLAAIQGVREGPPCQPSIALYRAVCGEGGVTCGQSDERGAVLALGGGGVTLLDIQPAGQGGGSLEVGGSSVRLGCERQSGPQSVSLALAEGQPRILRGHTGPVYGVWHLWQGPLLSCGEDATVRLWDRQSGAGLAVFRGHQFPVWCVQGDRMGLQFVTGSYDRTVRLWRPDTAHPLRVYAGHEASVDCVDWHPNCNYILSGSSDKTVRMWSHLDGRCVRVFTSHKGGVTTVACSPDGKLVATGGEDRRVKVWDLAQGKVLKELRGHTDSISSLVWGPDSRLLVTGGREGAVRVWDSGGAGEPELLASHTAGPGTQVVGMNFTDTNTLIVTAVEASG